VGLNAKQFPDLDFTFTVGDGRKVTVRDAIKGLPMPVFFERGLIARDIPFHPNHWTMQPKSPKLSPAKQTDGRSFRRLAWNEVSPTVAYGNREIHVHVAALEAEGQAVWSKSSPSGNGFSCRCSSNIGSRWAEPDRLQRSAERLHGRGLVCAAGD
jgi:hypothetical protein